MTPAYIITLQKLMSEKEALKHYNEVLKQRLRETVSKRLSVIDNSLLYEWEFPSIEKV